MNHQPDGCLVALIPAYNEAGSIAATIEAVLAQTRPADHVIVIPNGCTDDTADIARQYPVTVMELPRLPHKKSEALNIAWLTYAKDADTVICLDADTVLPPNAFADWEHELQADPTLGGSSSKFTMQKPGLLSRLQKAEFATWTATGLRLGHTSVLAGTGCAIRGQALRQVAESNSIDPSEESWNHPALNGKAGRIKAATAPRNSKEKFGSRTESHGPKQMGQSPKVLSFVTDATILPASTSTTSNSEPSSTISKTEMNADDSGTPRKHTANADSHLAIRQKTGPESVELAKPDTRQSIALEEPQNKGIETLQKCEKTPHVNGPWSYNSAVEDFFLTYQIRKLGYHCHISPTVRAYTDSMTTLKALWAQRMKWSVGTQLDLIDFGFNRLTWRDWAQQAMGLLNITLKLLWVTIIVGYALTGNLQIIWFWLLLPILFIALDIKRALIIPHRDWKDILIAATFFPNEAFMWTRAAWTTASWLTVIKTKITRKNTDLWDSQARAEGIA